MEIFKDIKGYEGMYQISNLGNVKSLSRPRSETQKNMITKDRILKSSISNRGYKRVILVKDKIKKSLLVHRLIAIAFIPNPENKKDINHKDSDRLNNNIDNLEWCTPKENTAHMIDNGRMNWSNAARGEKHGISKLTEDQVREIKTHLRDGNISQRQLARKYNIHNTAIYFIKSGRNWSHVTI
jgi:hypothetical protein